MKAFMSFTLILLICYMLGMIRSKGIECVCFMSRDYTTVLKGVAVLTVVWAHAGAAMNVGSIQFVAGMGVALFLICSGYGLEMSYQKKGLHGFWARRFLKLYIPYGIAALGALLVQGRFSFHTFINSVIFIMSGRGNWYIKYIVICYLLFYVMKIICERNEFFKQNETMLLFGIFVVWFVLDSIYFVNPVVPFLQARQMLCFPCGILISKHKTQIDDWIASASGFWKTLLVICLSIGIVCMGITQLPQIKALPHIISNIISLATVLPLALAVMVTAKFIPELFNNNCFMYCGVVSYEIFLIHSYTLPLIKPAIREQIMFILITFALSVLLHVICGFVDRYISLLKLRI